MLSFDFFSFHTDHAQVVYELGNRAFSSMPEYARPKDSVEFVSHMQGAANPAGRSWVAVAKKNGQFIGNVSATPFRFQTKTGQSVTGFQLGSIVIEPSMQRQGIGTRLITQITASLAAMPDSFIYIYPNSRSIQVLFRNGYEAAATIPTYVHFPTLKSFGISDEGKTKSVIRDGLTGVWDLELVKPSQLSSMRDAWPEEPGPTGGFVRDYEYCRWRYGGPETDDRYRFAVCHSREGRDYVITALANHEFKGIKFVIVVDVFSSSPGRHYGLAIKAAQLCGSRSAERMVYASSNIPVLVRTRQDVSNVPWGMAVPDRANPRPVKLLLCPQKSALTVDELSDSIAMAGDWMGF